MSEPKRKIFEQILVPLDGSPLAEVVLPVVITLGSCLGAKIYLLHVLEERAPQTVHGQQHLTTTQDAVEYLARVAATIPSGVEVERHVHSAPEHDVAASIAQHVEELNTDLVVLCAHGPGGPRRLVVGSIGQQVLRRVTVPVLLARRQTMAAPESTRMKTFMVPLDGTPTAEAALAPAVELAPPCGASIRLVRVVPTVETMKGDASAAARLLPILASATLDEEAATAAQYLAGVAARVTQRGVPAAGQIRRGDTVGELEAEAASAGVDLIVIATHGRSGLGALWGGSVAVGLLNRTAQPLLLIRVSTTDRSSEG